MPITLKPLLRSRRNSIRTATTATIITTQLGQSGTFSRRRRTHLLSTKRTFRYMVVAQHTTGRWAYSERTTANPGTTSQRRIASSFLLSTHKRRQMHETSTTTLERDVGTKWTTETLPSTPRALGPKPASAENVPVRAQADLRPAQFCQSALRTGI